MSGSDEITGTTLEKIQQIIRDLRATDPELARRIEERLADYLAARTEYSTTTGLPGLLQESRRALFRAIRRLRRILPDGFPQLKRLVERLGAIIGERGALGAVGDLAQKALSLEGMVFIDIVFYTPGSGESGSIAVPFAQYDIDDQYLVQTPASGDNTPRCFIACIYRKSHTLTDEPSTPRPVPEAEQTEVVMLQEYDCSRPPSPAVLSAACRKVIYEQLEY